MRRPLVHAWRINEENDEVESAQNKLVIDAEGNRFACFSVSVSYDGVYALAGANDGRIYLYDRRVDKLGLRVSDVRSFFYYIFARTQRDVVVSSVDLAEFQKLFGVYLRTDELIFQKPIELNLLQIPTNNELRAKNAPDPLFLRGKNFLVILFLVFTF